MSVKKKKQVKSSKPKAMTYSLNVEVAETEPTLEVLEKSFDLAGARLTYAHQQHTYWTAEVHGRSKEFNLACTRFKQKKHGFTDAELQSQHTVKLPSTAVWTYAK